MTQHPSTISDVLNCQSDINSVIAVIAFNKLKFVYFLPNWERKESKVDS